MKYAAVEVRITKLPPGLPVSDHDHAANGIVFGDHGELYIQVRYFWDTVDLKRKSVSS